MPVTPPVKRTKGQRRAFHQKALKASPRAETRYVQDLRRVVRGIHQGVQQAIIPFLDEMSADQPGLRYRRDAKTKEDLRQHVRLVTDMTIAGLRIHVAKHVGEAFDRMSQEVNKKNKAGLSLIGITPIAMGAEDVLKKARDENIQLVENAGRDYADDVREVFDDDDNFGVRVEDLKGELVGLMEQRGEVNESRAQLIARDQTLKTNAALTRDRYKKAGVDQYTWSTSMDDRVRPYHADLEDTVHSWDDPPVTNDDGDENHPGEDFQCRCVAIPYFGDEEEEPEEES